MRSLTFRLPAALCLLASVAGAHPDDLPATAASFKVAAAQLPAGTLGSGAWRYEVVPGWTKLPENVNLGPTHGGVLVDKAGLVYVTSDGPAGILVFSPDGKLLRTIAPEVNGIHGLVLRNEGGQEFIYGAHLLGRQVVKLDLTGKIIWKISCPTESGAYPALDDWKPNPKTPNAKPAATLVGHDGRTYVIDGYKPTAVAVGPDGRIYVADGYGASVIHEYTADRKWKRVIGSKGEGDGQFKTCHGIALDTRYEKPLLLVSDRENRRLIHLDLDGNFVRKLAVDLRRPCAVSIMGDYAAVAELEGRVVITDKEGKIVATLGDNPDKKQWATNKVAPEFWQDGIFTAPHGLSFDADGNLYVQDWNLSGRLSKLRRAPAKMALAHE
jgi:DNA-binding beta-propeller fold protein YncE